MDEPIAHGRAAPGGHTRELPARDTWRLLAIAVGVVASPAAAWASVFTPPSGLAPGTSYRLMFVTADAMDGTSSAISTYNSFATNEAAQNPLLPTTTWSAVVSTPTTNAIDNTDGGSTSSASYTSDPIYMVDGTEIVASLQNFFASNGVLVNSGFTTTLMVNPLTEDQNGNPWINSSNGGYFWSGSNADGSTATSAEMGSNNPQTWSLYFDGSPVVNGPFPNDTLLPMIAISAPIQVGTPVPEPASGPMFAAGVGLLAAIGLRRRSRTRA